MAAPWFLLALCFASGGAGLAYELLWMRALTLVFGSTAQATAITLAVFFLGLSAGQYLAGRRAVGLRRPLRAYAALEALVAGSAALYFAVLPLYRTAAPLLLARLGDASAPPLLIGALAALALALPCVAMGATLPVLGQLLVRRADTLAPTFGLLYAVQTLGGALGAFAAGFWLPGVIGFHRTYALAMAVSAAVALLAYAASRGGDAPPAPAAAPAPRSAPARSDAWPRLAIAIASASGFAALALEVLWTHMFSQALHNSVYSFAAILVTLLIALGLGGLLAAALARRWRDAPLLVLAALLTAAGLAVALSPFVFDHLTGGLRFYASGEGWAGYVRATFWCAAAVMLVPGILLGSVFPYTLRLAQRRDGGAGAIIGGLAAANTVGAVAGSLAAGFVVLPTLGLWGGIRAVALLYLAAAAVTAAAARNRVVALLPTVGVALLFILLDPTGLPHVHLAPGEELRSLRETASGTVAVTERDGVLALTLDGHYTVGANGAVYDDRRQAELPMLLHPRPRAVFLLGLGTGITAGGALFHPIDHLTVVELVPGIADAAREHFAPFANGLFSDPRARLVVGDARTVLRAAPGPYDVIVGDLFVPWDRGTGNLYTREHFTNVRDHLAADGVFAQWLPLYQLSWREFAVIARTMLAVFPQVTVWRGDFSSGEPALGLFGQRAARPLDLAAVVENVRRRPGAADYPEERARALALLFYAGNLSAAPQLVGDAPINSDDRPVIEYGAPATPMEVVRGEAEWLTGAALNRFWAQLAAAVPPARDPFLATVPAEERQRVEAGRLLHAATILRAAGHDGEARQAREEFRALVPADVAAAFQ